MIIFWTYCKQINREHVGGRLSLQFKNFPQEFSAACKTGSVCCCGWSRLQIFDHPTLRQCPTSLKSLVKTHFTSIYFSYRSSLAYNIHTNKTQTRHILKKIRMIKWMHISWDLFTSRLQTGEIFMVSLCGPSSWLQQNGIQKISVCTSAPMCQP